MPARKLSVAVAAIVTLGAACVPPPPLPPLGGGPHFVSSVERHVLYAGREVCMASLGLNVLINDDRSIQISSEVIVRGTGLPWLACAYDTWTFSASLSCDDITELGCGEATVPTPNGDVVEYHQVMLFRHRPDGATLGISFTGAWGGVANDTVSGRSPLIRCDVVTEGHRCFFQPLN